ncbi:Membrane protein YdfJ [Streptomyces sp. RB5]|uniref:Membrane protein YdfJ n=1 Tax=Streptomyces smaragdinus TaxID=2585196 RepID=A0A7K0CSG4_9ACTN|nr:MMPL family transporter [Streptomyces smaragdinus]MQY16391.1 Membrane protein YdfJ [Streptomyces smaragdinus]
MAALARFCFRHRYVVLLLWVVALAGIGLAGSAAGTHYRNDFELPGTESSHAVDLLKKEFPDSAGDTDTVVWQVPEGRDVRDAEVRTAMTAALTKVDGLPQIGEVRSPYARTGAAQISEDGRIAYAEVVFTEQAYSVQKDEVEQVIDAAQSTRGDVDGLRVELGGQAIQAAQEPPGGLAEGVGILAAAVILTFAFGSLLAMLLPIICAVFGIGAGLMTVGLLSHTFNMGDIAPLLGSLIGLGVSIDYALFIVTRHRTGLRRGLDPEEAAVRALNTAGRAVLFAGGTVCVALLGMLTLGMSFLNGIAVAGSVTVLFGVAAAVTLLPALLGVLGTRVLSRRQRRRLAEHGPEAEAVTGRSARWSALVERRPRVIAAVAAVIMVLVAVPLLSLRLGTTDQGNDPESATTRKAYDLLAEGFGPGFNGPLALVAEIPADGDRAALDRLVAAVGDTEGVAAVAPAPVPEGARLTVVTVVPTTSPQSKATDELIDRLRDSVIPEAEQGSTLRVSVGGATAINKDFAAVISDKLPLFIGVIIALGFVLLLLAFRSLVVPLTAALMNLLAATAAFGMLVAVFQWGWGSSLLGLGDEVPINSFLPVIMLAMLFGLSMDYQVFLVSRMHEEWVHTRDNARAVRVGLAESSRVINSAAIIMVCVFSAFILSGDIGGVMAGLGLAGAVALDAFVIRTMLVPAVMHMVGRANWWLPGWLDRRLPHVAVEPAEDAVVSSPAPSPVPVPSRELVTVGALKAPVPVGGGGAPEPAVIRGTVRDSLGVPLPRCALTLLSGAGRQVGKTRSGDDGSYELTAPGSGSYTLVATSPALGAASVHVLVGTGAVERDLTIAIED